MHDDALVVRWPRTSFGVHQNLLHRLASMLLPEANYIANKRPRDSPIKTQKRVVRESSWFLCIRTLNFIILYWSGGNQLLYRINLSIEQYHLSVLKWSLFIEICVSVFWHSLIKNRAEVYFEHLWSVTSSLFFSRKCKFLL